MSSTSRPSATTRTARLCIFRRKVMVPKQNHLEARGGEQPGRPTPTPDKNWPGPGRALEHGPDGRPCRGRRARPRRRRAYSPSSARSRSSRTPVARAASIISPTSLMTPSTEKAGGVVVASRHQGALARGRTASRRVRREWPRGTAPGRGRARSARRGRLADEPRRCWPPRSCTRPSARSPGRGRHRRPACASRSRRRPSPPAPARCPGPRAGRPGRRPRPACECRGRERRGAGRRRRARPRRSGPCRRARPCSPAARRRPRRVRRPGRRRRPGRSSASKSTVMTASAPSTASRTPAVRRDGVARDRVGPFRGAVPDRHLVALAGERSGHRGPHDPGPQHCCTHAAIFSARRE